MQVVCFADTFGRRLRNQGWQKGHLIASGLDRVLWSKLPHGNRPGGQLLGPPVVLKLGFVGGDHVLPHPKKRAQAPPRPAPSQGSKTIN
jgi:hypothetical protein